MNGWNPSPTGNTTKDNLRRSRTLTIRKEGWLPPHLPPLTQPRRTGSIPIVFFVPVQRSNPRHLPVREFEIENIVILSDVGRI